MHLTMTCSSRIHWVGRNAGNLSYGARQELDRLGCGAPRLPAGRWRANVPRVKPAMVDVSRPGFEVYPRTRGLTGDDYNGPAGKTGVPNPSSGFGGSRVVTLAGHVTARDRAHVQRVSQRRPAFDDACWLLLMVTTVVSFLLV